MPFFSKDTLNRLWPHCEAHCPGLIDGIVATQDAVFSHWGLTTPLVVAHAMAQFSHEFGAGTEMEENLNYRAEQLLSQWPKHFTTAQAYSMAHHPQQIANQAYNGRMGNRDGTDDGWNFRGRGGSQLTGRENYEKLSQIMGLDLLTHPEYLAAPEHFLECAVADFVALCHCLPYAEQDDIHGVTQHLNGGQIGASERHEWLIKWKAALGPTAAIPVVVHPADGTLRYGDHGWEVKAAQTQLGEKGYNVGEPDGRFGATTRAAVLALQADNNLPTTGDIDRATKDALGSAPPRPVAEARATATVADLREKGSETVAAADHIGTLAKGAAGVGGAIGAEKTGLLDQAQQASDQFGVVRSIAETAQDAIHWAEGHLWLGLIIGGAVALYFGRDIIKERLAHYKAGAGVLGK